MTPSSEISKPIPRAEELDAEFYAHCAQGRLCFQRCTSCRTWRHLPRRMCAKCGSPEWEWAPSTGKGRIYTWTVTHQAMHPAWSGEVPYAVIVVEMEEGVRVVSALREASPDALELDLPVEVAFERVSDEIALPVFHPASS